MGGVPSEKQIDEESETETSEQTNLDAQEQLHFDWFTILWFWLRPDNLVFTTDCKRHHKKSRRKMDKGLISVTTIPSSLSLPTARGKLASQADFV